MITFARFPCGIALRILADNPRFASRVEQILRSKDVNAQEKLRIFNATVYMALGRKVDHIVDIVLGKEAVEQLPITDVALYEEATLTVDVVFDGSQVSGVCQRVKNNDLNIFVLILSVEQILDKIGTDKSSGTCY